MVGSAGTLLPSFLTSWYLSTAIHNSWYLTAHGLHFLVPALLMPASSHLHYSRSLSSVRYGAGQGGFSLCDPTFTPARGQHYAVPPRPV